MSKSRDAFRTISEVSKILSTPAHVLRFWESKFTQVKPVKRAGGRRYYRPADVDLLAGIKQLLHEDGMTIKGAQKLLRDQGVKHVSALGKAALEAEIPADGTAPIEASAIPVEAPEVKSASPERAASQDQPTGTPPPVQDTPKDAALQRGDHADAPLQTAQEPEAEIQPDAPAQSDAPAPPEAAPEPETPDLFSFAAAQPEQQPRDAAPHEAPEAAPREASGGNVVPLVAPQDVPAADDLAQDDRPDDAAESRELAPSAPDTSPSPDASGAPVDLPSFDPADVVETETKNAAPDASTDAPNPARDIPADPADNDSKRPARIFHLIQRADRGALAARREEIAPLLDRMQILRDRLQIR